MDLSQGDIVRIDGYRQNVLVISKNAFIRSTGMVHVCPFFKTIAEGPLHIAAKGIAGTVGVAAAEQIKLIDPAARNIRKTDRLQYADIMEISDAVHGIFEYD